MTRRRAAGALAGFLAALACRAGAQASASPAPDAPAPQATVTPALAPTPPPPPPWPPGLTEARLLAIESAAASAMARLGIPGMSVALAHATAPDIVWSRGYGSADVENDVPAGAATVYRLASLSKPLTAVTVMQLAEQDRLDLDAPIQRYVPAFPDKPWPVTARALLCHQAGVRHVADDEWGSTRHYASVASALEVFKDDPLLFQPTTRALYSTYGYNLLGAAVEGASGAAYLDFLREHVLAPAGAEGIRDDDVFAIIRRRGRGYRRVEGELRNAMLADTSSKVPGGGLVGTAHDVARVGTALLAGRLLKSSTLKLMFTPQKLRDGRRTEYTLGWRTTRRRRLQEIWHHGGQPQVSNLIYLLPERGLVVVLLCNLEGVMPGLLDLAREIADLALDAPLLRG